MKKPRHSFIEEGREAYRQGKKTEDNPYDGKSTDIRIIRRNDEWSTGWKLEESGDEDIPD